MRRRESKGDAGTALRRGATRKAGDGKLLREFCGRQVGKRVVGHLTR
jgi:hypothetical protein